MGTCFHPGVNKVVIYVDLIQQIYSQGKEVILRHQDPQDSYDAVHQRISKKGLYRKLCEHLMSHRSNVNECMMHIFKNVMQMKDPNSYYVNLTLIDQMTRHLEGFVDDQLIKSKRIEKEDTESVKSEYINRDIQVKFQTLYFQMIIEIYDEYPDIRKCILVSLIKFAEKDRNLSNGRLVDELVGRLIQLISRNAFMENATKAYSLLIDKSPDSVTSDEKSEEALRIFLDIWLSQQEQGLKLDCQKIFRIYISKCLTSRQFGCIYTVIFEKEDMYQFDKGHMEQLETKLFGIVQQEDFKDQFFIGIFKYLVMYLCVCADEKVRNTWELGLFDIPYLILKNKYPNILKKTTKINAFLTILRWIKFGVVNPNEFILYNRSSLLNCLVFNVCSYLGDRQILESSVETFFEIYRCCNHSSKVIICALLLEQIHKSRDGIVEETSIFVRINKKVLEDLSTTKLDETSYNMFCPIEGDTPAKTKIQLIQLQSLLLECFDTPFEMVLVENICSFVQSFQGFLDYHGPVRQKYQLACSMVSFFKKLKSKGEEQIIVAFLKRYYQNKKQITTFDGTYFSGYLTLEIAQLLLRRQIVPPQMRKLNLKLYGSTNTNVQSDIKTYLSTFDSHLDQLVIKYLNTRSQESQLRVEFIQREFAKCQRRNSIKQDQIELNFLTTGFQHKKSWIFSSNNSYRTDETFTDIFGMINNDRVND